MLFLCSGGLGRETQLLSRRVISGYHTCSRKGIYGSVVSISTFIMPTPFETFHREDLKITGSAMTYNT